VEGGREERKRLMKLKLEAVRGISEFGGSKRGGTEPDGMISSVDYSRHGGWRGLGRFVRWITLDY
jgi:hypothetical protein